jgi:hypothetical protein
MTDRFKFSPRSIEIETHTRYVTHYIQKIDIVDTTTDETVETVTAFDSDGREAAIQAWHLALEAIGRRHEEEEKAKAAYQSGASI